jgi:hypothetical protein
MQNEVTEDFDDTRSAPNARIESVQRILTSGRHLLQLIDRILAVSKSQLDDLSFLETPATQNGRELKRAYV